jgi:hypothetical protein
MRWMSGFNQSIIYISNQGAFLDLYADQPIPSAEIPAYFRGLGFGQRRTVTAGTKPGQSEAFVEDMVGFFKAQLRQS